MCIRDSVLSRIAYIDLNGIVFPKNFKSLTIKHVRKIRWWNIEENILKELKVNKKTFKSLYIKEDDGHSNKVAFVSDCNHLSYTI